MTNSENLSPFESAGSSLADRLASRLTFPVASLSDALEQLGTSLSGVAVLSAASTPATEAKIADVPGTLNAVPAEAARLEQAYFPLESVQQLAAAVAAERGRFRPVGNWMPPA
jgi:hypothetical protein